MMSHFIANILILKTIIVTSVWKLGVLILRFIFFHPTDERQRLADLVKRKQNERQDEFARLRTLFKLRSEEEHIVTLRWDDLVGKLQRRELTATKVLEAFIAKAIQVSDKCNPITDFISQAHVWAKELDALKVVKGPLHGIPFCVKDDTDVIGMDNTHGYAKRLYKPATESAVIVKVLQDLGAIPFCKTNIPQTLWSYGSDNPIFGTTTNPHNVKLSPGGSSSGTGALVGAHAAPFGTGTDIGGSLRVPAHWNGVASIKPTSSRLSLQGCVSPVPKLVGMGPSVGVIAQNPSIVAAVMSKMLESGRQLDYDPLAMPIPWNSSIFESKHKLRIGYFTSIPYFPTMGDSGEMVLKGKKALESLGHTLVSFDMPDAYNYLHVLTKIMTADQSRHLKECWNDEELGECVKPLWMSSKIPTWMYKCIRSVLLSKASPLHSKRTAVLFGHGAFTSYDVWDAIAEKNEIRNEILRKWEELNLDVLICNVLAVPAPPLEAPMLPSPYAVIFNLVDLPAGVVTLGAESGKRLTDFDDEGDLVLKMAFKDVKESIGAPIGIQVVGKPFREEVVLRVMKELEPFNTFHMR